MRSVQRQGAEELSRRSETHNVGKPQDEEPRRREAAKQNAKEDREATRELSRNILLQNQKSSGYQRSDCSLRRENSDKEMNLLPLPVLRERAGGAGVRVISRTNGTGIPNHPHPNPLPEYRERGPAIPSPDLQFAICNLQSPIPLSHSPIPRPRSFALPVHLPYDRKLALAGAE